jgi:GT2 family glycosyltransferase
VVVDNDPEQTAKQVVEEFAGIPNTEFVYVGAGRNLGPAGGWALGIDVVRGRSERGQWVTVLDDDDPVGHPEVLERLASAAAAAPSTVAAIGLRGAVLDPRTATLTRVTSTDLETGSVDYLASGGVPFYRWEAIDEVGFFDGALFFGFEDLDLGLRLRRAGHRLLVHPLDDLHRVPNTAGLRSPWREYYKTRALVVIARRHLGWLALLATLARSLLAGSVVLALRDRRVSLIVARWWGAADGLRERLGPRRYLPAENPPKA